MWLYVPSAFVQASEGSTSGSDSEPSSERPTCALFVTSSGKPMQRLLSWRGWQTRPWIKLLSGPTFLPSTVARGVARWISSLAGSPASRIASLASAEGPTTAGGSGPTSGASCAIAGQLSLWSKTSLGSDPPEGSVRSCKTLPMAGGMRNGLILARTRLAPLTTASGSSSWPTPKAARYGSSQNGSNSSKPSAGTPSLDTIGREWSKREGSEPLAFQAVSWPTPTATDAKASGWGPSSIREGTKRHGGTTLTDAAVRSATVGPQGETASVATGPKSSLNPAFVEALMGLTEGFSIAQIDCEPSATPSCPNKQPMRSPSFGDE